ncbi:MAG: hypothetical protein GTO02_11815 [Candidatus Dadabacteria bacterium]|nr:hypothetical protein [Candidatus Dadabacteria bacterium]
MSDNKEEFEKLNRTLINQTEKIDEIKNNVGCISAMVFIILMFLLFCSGLPIR